MQKHTNSVEKKIKSIKAEYLVEFEDKELPEDLDQFYNIIKPMMMKCNDCILHSSRSIVVAPDGKPNTDIMVILEGPGFLEDKTGVPLVGPLELRGSRCSTCANSKPCFNNKYLLAPFKWKKKGEYLKQCTPRPVDKITLPESIYLHSTGSVIDGILMKWKFMYPRHNWVTQYNTEHVDNPWTHESPFFITNAVLCRSVDPLTGVDTRPNRTHWEACRKLLVYQWVACNPKIIICFGRTALATILGNDKAALRAKVNEVIDTKFGPVIFNNHPSFYMREENKTIRALGYAKLKRTFEMALEYTGRPI